MARRNVDKSTSEVAAVSDQGTAVPLDVNIMDALSLLTGGAAREDSRMSGAVEEIEQVERESVQDEEDTGAYSSDGTEEVVDGAADEQDGASSPMDNETASNGAEADPEAWRAYLASDKQREQVASYEKQITEFDQQIVTGTNEVDMLQKMIDSRSTGSGGTRKKALETEQKTLKERIARAAENLRITTEKMTKLVDAAKGKMTAAGDKQRKSAQGVRDKAATSALARVERYHITPLTSKQLQRRATLETEARGELSQVQEHTLKFCYTLEAIYKERLWIDHQGGMAGYTEQTFGIKKSQMYRDIAIPEQMESLRALLSKNVQYLDAAGNPEKVTLNPDQLPQNKGQLDKLAKYGSTENQLKVWEQIVLEAEANQIRPTEALVKRIGDAMVASGEVAVGLDAELDKAQRAAEAERAGTEGVKPKLSPLNFNVWENIALWGGHEFAVRSYKTPGGAKKFEPRVDHVSVERAGEVVLFDTLLAATKLLEEEARKLVTDQWTEENPAPDASANGAGTEVTAAPLPVKAKGKAAATTWYVGMDGDKPDPFDHDTAKKGEPTTTVTGYDAIVGPFPTKVNAMAYAEKIRTGAVPAPNAPATAAA